MIEDYGLEYLPWPTYSPDMNPIENLFSYLKGQVAKLIGPQSSEIEIFEATKKAFFDTPKIMFKRLVNSMPARIQALKIAHGGYTRY